MGIFHQVLKYNKKYQFYKKKKIYELCYDDDHVNNQQLVFCTNIIVTMNSFCGSQLYQKDCQSMYLRLKCLKGFVGSLSRHVYVRKNLSALRKFCRKKSINNIDGKQNWLFHFQPVEFALNIEGLRIKNRMKLCVSFSTFSRLKRIHGTNGKQNRLKMD